jgi:hypothetical protein
MLAFDAPVPPSLDLRVDLIVQIGNRARAHPRAPEQLRDVIPPPERKANQLHLDRACSTELLRRRQRPAKFTICLLDHACVLF